MVLYLELSKKIFQRTLYALSCITYHQHTSIHIYSLFIEFSTNAFRKKYIFISYKFYREPFLCISYFSLFLISILYANPYRYEAYSKKYMSARVQRGKCVNMLRIIL